MKVRDAYKKFSDKTDIVNLDTPIEKVIDIFMKSRERRNVYVVDKSNKLVGMIRAQEIFKSVRPDITPNKIIFFLKKADIKMAKDIMIQPEIVMLDDELEDALRTAEVFKIQDIPVCKNGKLVGELDAFELVYGLMKSKK